MRSIEIAIDGFDGRSKRNYIPSWYNLCKCVLECDGERGTGLRVSDELLESWVLFEMLKAGIVFEEVTGASSVLIGHLL